MNKNVVEVDSQEKRQRILIVDDEPANITILANLFGDSYNILVALDGENALKIARSKNPPDLILLDIMMPVMHGYEVCKILQADSKTKDIPIIFVTTLSGVEDENKGLALGAVDFINKPFHNSIVRARVKTHLHIKKQRDQLLRQQQELDSSHRRTLMILRTASEGIFGIDTSFNITFINPAALKMIGCNEDDILGKNSCSIMHHTKQDGDKRTSKECLACKTILTGQSLETNEDIYWRQDHTSFPVSFSAAPAFENGAIIGAVIVFKDITKQQQLEQELFKADKNEAFQVLAGGLAHDFNNLLMAINANLDLALWPDVSDNERQEYLHSCQQAATVATDLAAKFLTIAKSGKATTTIIDIKHCTKQVIDSLYTDQQIDYQVEIPADIWPLSVDAVQFLQLLKNIIGNAQEATPDEGMIIIKAENCPNCRKKYSQTGTKDYLLISIQDKGSGITEEHKKKIFDPYFSTKDRGSQKGMGLGLTICNAIMQKHNGFIDLKTKTGQGTTVYLYFPAADVNKI